MVILKCREITDLLRVRVNQGKMWELKLELQIFQVEMGLAYTWVSCTVPR